MGTKYCPNCKQVVVTKALGSYSQVDFNGVPVMSRPNPVNAGGRSARARGEPRNQADSPVAWIPTGGRWKVSEGGQEAG